MERTTYWQEWAKTESASDIFEMLMGIYQDELEENGCNPLELESAIAHKQLNKVLPPALNMKVNSLMTTLRRSAILAMVCGIQSGIYHAIQKHDNLEVNFEVLFQQTLKKAPANTVLEQMINSQDAAVDLSEGLHKVVTEEQVEQLATIEAAWDERQYAMLRLSLELGMSLGQEIMREQKTS